MRARISAGVSAISEAEARAGWPGLIELIKSFPGQARLALGTRGVLFATVAGAVGLACCLIAFAEIALSLHRSDVDPQRRRARDVLELARAEQPRIDTTRGGTVQGVIDGLNMVLDLTVPERNQMGGTRVIPGHGRHTTIGRERPWLELVQRQGRLLL